MQNSPWTRTPDGSFRAPGVSNSEVRKAFENAKRVLALDVPALSRMKNNFEHLRTVPVLADRARRLRALALEIEQKDDSGRFDDSGQFAVAALLVEIREAAFFAEGNAVAVPTPPVDEAPETARMREIANHIHDMTKEEDRDMLLYAKQAGRNYVEYCHAILLLNPNVACADVNRLFGKDLTQTSKAMKKARDRIANGLPIQRVRSKVPTMCQ